MICGILCDDFLLVNQQSQVALIHVFLFFSGLALGVCSFIKILLRGPGDFFKVRNEYNCIKFTLFPITGAQEDDFLNAMKNSPARYPFCDNSSQY